MLAFLAHLTGFDTTRRRLHFAGLHVSTSFDVTSDKWKLKRVNLYL